MNTRVEPTIIALDKAHLPDIESLLSDCQLPFEDCAEQLDYFFGVFDDRRLIASGALEVTGDAALLRSIAVNSDYRGNGLAAAMTRHLLAAARSMDLNALYLLTETAADYFESYGFYPIAREEIPTEIKSTRQFASLCPTTAQAMRLDL